LALIGPRKTPQHARPAQHRWSAAPETSALLPAAKVKVERRG
jgi:hypothetical protein